MNKILVVAAHPDDDILGMGGTLAKYSKQGNEIKVIFMTDGVSSRKIKPESSAKRFESAIKAQKSGLHGPPTLVLLFLQWGWGLLMHNMGPCSRPGGGANAWKQFGPKPDPGRNRASV